MMQARLAALQERAAAQESRLLSTIYPPVKQNQTQTCPTREEAVHQGSIHSRESTEQRCGQRNMEHPWCLNAQDNDATMRVRCPIVQGTVKVL